MNIIFSDDVNGSDFINLKYNPKHKFKFIITEKNFYLYDGNKKLAKCGYVIHDIDNFVYIYNFLVNNEYQHLGLGFLLLTKAIEYLKTKSLNSVELDVLSNNTNALGIYKKMGFKEMKHGNDFNRLILPIKNENKYKFIPNGHVFELYDGDMRVGECSHQPMKNEIIIWGLRFKQDTPNDAIEDFFEKTMNNLKGKGKNISYELTKKSVKLIDLLNRFGFKTTNETENTLTMTNFVGNKEIDEDFDYNEPKYYKDQEIFMYEPTQDEIDRFIKHNYQFKEKQNNKDYNIINSKKKKTQSPQKNGYAFLTYLSQPAGYGPINLMRWRKRKEMDKNPVEGVKYTVIPDTGNIKPHDTRKYFY